MYSSRTRVHIFEDSDSGLVFGLSGLDSTSLSSTLKQDLNGVLRATLSKMLLNFRVTSMQLMVVDVVHSCRVSLPRTT